VIPVFEQPKIITFSEFVKVVYPKVEGYIWALDTIVDFWRTCTPTPDQVLNPNDLQNEKRIIHPGNFVAWWTDICQHQGIEYQPNTAIPGVRTH